MSSNYSLTSPSVTSVSTVSTLVSTSPLRKKSNAQPEKDYFAALGALQTSYGFGGGAPVRPAVPSRPSKAQSATVASAPATTSSQPSDYEATFGSLSSTYGFGGCAPTPASQTSSDSKKSLKFWKRAT